MATVNLNTLSASFANVRFDNADSLKNLSAAQATDILNNIRTSISSNGKVETGYLSLQKNTDGSFSLENRSRFDPRGDKERGAQLIRTLMTVAYGNKIGPTGAKQLNDAIDSYLRGNVVGAKMGTVSLVKFMAKADLQSLVGQSFRPQVAEKLLHVLNFDGVGRLIGPKPGAQPLTDAQWTELVAGKLDKGLAQTNAAEKGNQRGAARTEREVLLDFSSELRKAREGAAPALQARLDAAITQVKNHWLNFQGAAPGAADSTRGLLADLARDLRDDAPALAQKADVLAAEAAKPKHRTQAYDNTFGRQFESALVHELVQQPPQPVVDAALKTGEYLFSQIEALATKDREAVLTRLRSAMAADQRPWHAETPDVKRFLDAPTMANLQAMLKPAPPGGYDVVKVSWLAVKISTAGFGVEHRPDYMKQANDNYNSVVATSRSGVSSPIAQVADQAQVLPVDQQNVFVPHTEREVLQEFSSQLEAAIDTAKPAERGPLRAAIAQVEQLLNTLEDANAGATYDLLVNLAKQMDTAKLFKLGKVALALANEQAPHIQTTGYGTALPHQPALEGGEGWLSGASVQGKVTLDFSATGVVRAFDTNALAHEMNSVNGPSGSTNIMTFLYLQMQQNDPSFNLQDAFAGTMMFLTLDGGHSLPESVGTFRAITADTRQTQVAVPGRANVNPASDRAEILASRQTVLNTNVLAYGDLHQLFAAGGDTARGVEEAVGRAWARTEETFDRVHAERWNNEPEAPSLQAVSQLVP